MIGRWGKSPTAVEPINLFSVLFSGIPEQLTQSGQETEKSRTRSVKIKNKKIILKQ